MKGAEAWRKFEVALEDCIFTEIIAEIQSPVNKKILSPEKMAVTYKAMQENAIGRSAQSNGFTFELLIFSLLHHEGLEPATGYRPKGEQIDGSFLWNGTTFLIEAKWTKERLPVSDIYSFKGKLDGKFHTTSGIFLSASGFSPDVEDALKFGKTLNIILFDAGDIELLFTGEVKFSAMLKYKLRQAGDTGNVLVPYKIVEQARRIDDLDGIESEDIADYDDTTGLASTLDDLLVFVEGERDIAIARSLIESFGEQLRVTYKIVTLAGANNIRLLPSLVSDYIKRRKVSAILIFLDDDVASPRMQASIEAVLENLKKSSLTVSAEFVLLSSSTKKLLVSREIKAAELEIQPAIRQTLDFLKKIAQENYNQEEEIFLSSLETALADITFDAENESVYSWDDFWQTTSRIDSLEDFIAQLDNEVIDSVESAMPDWWVKDNGPLGYGYEIREYLSDHYKEKIESVGWDAEEL